MRAMRDTDPTELTPDQDTQVDHDTGPVSHAARIKADAALALRDAFDTLSEAEKALAVAHHMAEEVLGTAAELEAARTPTRLERIEQNVAEILRILQSREDALLTINQRVVALEAWKARHLHENHCENCELRRESGQALGS